jgi:transposase InsO family protein
MLLPLIVADQPEARIRASPMRCCATWPRTGVRGPATTAPSQYTSIDFGRTLCTSGVVASMGSIGDAFDNAMAESCFATPKAELIYRLWIPERGLPL